MKRILSTLAGATAALAPALALAEEATGPTTKELSVVADTVWVLLCAFLVFFMHAGFALLETGFSRKKNVVNILAKNFLIVALTSVVFYLVGFAFMFGNGNSFIFGGCRLWVSCVDSVIVNQHLGIVLVQDFCF